MTGGNHNINEVGESVAVLLAELKNLSKNFDEFKNSNEKFCDNITRKVNDNENGRIAIEQRQSNLTVFQSVLSIIIGAIATYLGVKK